MMKILGKLTGGWRRDVLDELDSHIQMDTEHLMGLGMSYAAARRQAMLNLGGVQATLESCDDAVRLRPVWRFVRQLRSLFRQGAPSLR